VVDVSDFGRSTRDLADSVILLHGDSIEAVGDSAHVAIPKGTRVIDAKGSYVVPGLIDGFGALRTQGFASAYLFEGVTSVFVQHAPEGQDGESKQVKGDPGPELLTGEMIGGYSADGSPDSRHPWTDRRLQDTRLTSEQIQARVAEVAANGARALLIGMDVWPDQLDVAVRAAREHGLATLAEMAFTSYPYAVRAGVSVLLRSDRYETAIDLAQDWLAYSDDPQGRGGAAGYRGVCNTDANADRVTAFGSQLAASHTALMPMLSIEANADDLNVPNPWTRRSAVFVTAADLDDPVDSHGGHPYLLKQPERAQALKDCAYHRQALDARFHALGAHYLAGSATPAFGNVPGGGLHGELDLLTRIGLTPREALAAATWNFSSIFGWKDRGAIEAGRVADIVVLGSDPRVSIAALDDIRVVVHAGSVVNRAALRSKAAQSNH
jgi:hypothetical protein